MGAAREFSVHLLIGLCVHGYHVSFCDVQRIDQAAIGAEVDVVVLRLVALAHFPPGNLRLGSCACGRWRRHILRPFINGVAFVGIHDPFYDGALGMGVKGAKAIHSANHGLPVHGFLRRAKADRADLVAVATIHLEVQLIAVIVEFEHAEAAIGRTLSFQLPTGSGRHLDVDAFGARGYIIKPDIIQALLSGAHAVILVVQVINGIGAVGGGEYAGGLAVFGVMRRDEYAAHAFAVLRYRAADFFG